MGIEENKKVVEDFFQALRTGDTAWIDRITTDDFAFRPMGRKEGGIQKETFMKLIDGVLEAFPDHTSWIDDIVAEGDMVAVAMMTTGTHTGQWGKYAPTDKYFSIPEAFFLRIEGGKVAEYWGIKDALGQFQQLGILPPNEEIG